MIYLKFCLLVVCTCTTCDAFRHPEEQEAAICKYDYQHMDLKKYGYTEYEIMCKIKQNQKIIINVAPKTFYDIDCDNIPTVNYSDLPSPVLEDDETTFESNFSIEKCPLTNTSFAEILRNQRVKKTPKLLLKYSNYENIQRKHFAGLSEYTITSLVINSCGMKELPRDLFVDLINLRNLDLYSNRIRPPKGLFDSLINLRTLTLSENNITALPDGIFSSLSSLTTLYLGRNRLSVRKATFHGLHRLNLLDLSENLITDIPEDTLEHLKRLEELNLSFNNFSSVPGDLMRRSKNMIKFTLSYNRVNLKTIAENFLSNLPNLQEVSITVNGVEVIPGNVFANSPEIIHISLEDNKIVNLPESIFKDQIMLEVLNLRRNKIEKLPDRLFQNNMLLEDLIIDDNFIKKLSSAIFQGLVNMKTLSVKNNNLKYVETLPSLSSLLRVDMSHNNLSWESDMFTPTSSFKNLANLRHLNLSHNCITVFCQDWMLDYMLPNLEYLDLSFNHIGDIDNFFDINFSKDLKKFSKYFTLDLQHNQITALLHNIQASYQNYQEPKSNVRILISYNPIRCNCQLLTFIKFLKNPKVFQQKRYRHWVRFDIIDGMCESPSSLKDRKISTVKPEELACIHKSEGWCTHFEYPYKLARKIICVKDDMNPSNPMPKLESAEQFDFNHTELYLENSGIREFRRFGKAWENITKLSLRGNKLIQLAEEDIPSKIEVLDLRNNSLVFINESVARKIIKGSNLRVLKISGNPIACDCGNEKFLSMLTIEREKVIDYKYIQCQNGSFVSDLRIGHLCADIYNWVPLVATLVPFGIIIFLVVWGWAHLKDKRKQEVNIWLKEHVNWYIMTPTPPDLHNLEYDVFVCGAHEDNVFAEHLVSELENLGYIVCWHSRDFVVGEFVNNNMANAILKSQATLPFVTEKFLQSSFCLKEFVIADLANTVEGRSFIPILGDDNVVSVDNVDPVVAIYFTKRTYLEFSDKIFWKRLCVSLPKKLRDIRPCSKVYDHNEDERSNELKEVKIKDDINKNTQNNVKSKIGDENIHLNIGDIDSRIKNNNDLLNIFNNGPKEQIVINVKTTHMCNENIEKRQDSLANSEEIADNDVRKELLSNKTLDSM